MIDAKNLNRGSASFARSTLLNVIRQWATHQTKRAGSIRKGNRHQQFHRLYLRNGSRVQVPVKNRYRRPCGPVSILGEAKDSGNLLSTWSIGCAMALEKC